MNSGPDNDHQDTPVSENNHHQKARNHPEVPDRFTELMFGNRVFGRKKNYSPTNNQENEFSEVNYFTLFQQLDDILDSLEELKPVVQQISPLIDYFKKKK